MEKIKAMITTSQTGDTVEFYSQWSEKGPASSTWIKGAGAGWHVRSED